MQDKSTKERAGADTRRIAAMKRRIEEAQRSARKYVEPGVSLVEELLAERRAEARREEEE